VVGFSWGGLANLFAASRDDRIGALVALDGSMRGFPGVVKEAGDVHPEEMTIPLLFFKGQHSIEDEDQLRATFHDPGPNVLNEWVHGDLISVSMLGLVHPEFSSRAQRNEGIWANEFAGMQEADYGRQDGVIGYAWVARYTREFLDAYLKQDAAAKQFLTNTPAENGVALHTIAVQYRRAQSMPASFSSFRVEVRRSGFNHAGEIYEATRKKQPGFVLTPDTVTDWAHELLAEGHTPEAIDIMKFAIQLEPSSSNYASLGEMEVDAGQLGAARKSYEKALELNPKNLAAKEGLERVQGMVRP
jgi:tetratricopeptide (TPR) repeat protein